LASQKHVMLLTGVSYCQYCAVHNNWK